MIRISPTCLIAGRSAEQGAADQGQPHARHRPPEQDDDAGHDQGLEPDVGHDHRLDLDLVGVEQHRRDRQRGKPARQAAADHDHVQGDGDRQAEQVLDDLDRAEVADRPR